MGRKSKKLKEADEVTEVKRWFAESVTYEGKAYTLDDEQAAAVIDESPNTIVVARAGSGKTRTIVAKIVYLVAKCGVRSDEIMAFVFNADAAAEINQRLGKMMVDGGPAITGVNGEKLQIASTFHAFARRIIYDVYGGKGKCGRILADGKDEFVSIIVERMLLEPEWRGKIWRFFGYDKIENESTNVGVDVDIGKGVGVEVKIDERDLVKFGRMMAQFVNRAQQGFLAGERTLMGSIEQRRQEMEWQSREGLFIELGAECYRRYHWYLLDETARVQLGDAWATYGTDFNLIVSWASKVIVDGGDNIEGVLGNKRYILVDEYQDFSQLFLAVILAVRRVVLGVKLFVVGDDWQAINRFAGSDVRYFKEFERYFSDGARRLEITTNYRCNREIVRMAGKFMHDSMGECGKFKAFSRRAGKVYLVNPRNTLCACAMVESDVWVSGRDRVYYEMARRMFRRRRSPKIKTVRYMKTLVRLIRENKKCDSIMILDRHNETEIEGIGLVGLSRGLKWGLVNLKIMSEKEYDEKVRVMTMHKSKGLEADVVILIEVDEGIIPKTHADTELYGIFGETEEIALDDQKRLFYVAMTRAKKKLYIMHEGSGRDGFVKYLGGAEKWEW